ncbi:MAG: anti-sigma F factor [Clostridia bacterium]
MNRNEMHLSFLGKSENEGFARVVAAAFATKLNPTIDELSDIRTAVSEAVTNAIIHGYDNKAKTVYMDGEIEGNKITIVIRDKGKGIEDIELAMQPFYTSRPNMDRTGMGFSVMQAFMDEVQVESIPNIGTSVTLIKQIKEAEGDD